MSPEAPAIAPFSDNPEFDFAIRCVLGFCVDGAADPGEVLAATAGVGSADQEGWCAAWSDLGARTAAVADAASHSGHRVSASEAYLRASVYWSVAVNAASALGDDELLASAFAAQESAWRGFVAHTAVHVDERAIPYQGSRLPGWLFRPSTDAPSPRPMLVAVNGSDGPRAGLWATCIAPALRRGYTVLAFDGPGQQSELFEKGRPFRPDWEHVLGPVYEFAAGLPGTDAGRIAVYGISQGGYWVARALAFEHRFAAGIVDPGVVDVSASWIGYIPAELLALLDAGQTEEFDREIERGLEDAPEVVETWRFRARPYGTTGYAETLQAVRQYSIADIAAQIRTPLLILDPDAEQFWPGQSEELAGLTRDGISTLVRFTAAEGADGHCEPLARGVTAQRMFDWLDEQLAGTAP